MVFGIVELLAVQFWRKSGTFFLGGPKAIPFVFETTCIIFRGIFLVHSLFWGALIPIYPMFSHIPISIYPIHTCPNTHIPNMFRIKQRSFLASCSDHCMIQAAQEDDHRRGGRKSEAEIVDSVGTVTIWGFPQLGVPQKWMVDFMENPI